MENNNVSEAEKPKNTFLHDTMCLFVITLVAGLLLGAAYSVTKKPIEIQNQKTKQEAYENVYKGAKFVSDSSIDSNLTAFNEKLAAGKIKDGDETLNDAEISEVLKATIDGKDAGYVMTTSAKGYGGSITIALGFDSTGTIKGIQITDCSNETPGLGQNSANKDFNSQYLGIDISKTISVVKDGSGSKDNGTINAISGATITSKAVTRAVNAARQFEKSLI